MKYEYRRLPLVMNLLAALQVEVNYQMSREKGYEYFEIQVGHD